VATLDETYVLAVDMGTSGCKTALVSATGRVVGWEFEAVPLHLFADGGAEQDPADWWSAFLATAGRLLRSTVIPAERIVAVCCSTQGEATVPVDAAGNALMNAILWMDMRGAPHIRQLTGGVPKVAGYGARKLFRWVRLTGGAPSLSGKDPAAHMLLVRDEFPEVYRKTHAFLNVLDYLNLRLTGRFVATADSITTSWVTDNRDSAHVRYHPALLRACRIDPAMFPEIVPCTANLGPLLPEVARELGLRPETSVVAGAIDTTAAAIGSGAIADFEAHLYIGTSSWLAAHVPFKKTDVGSSLASLPSAIPGRYLMTILQTTAGGNLAYLRDQVLYHKDELLREAQVPDVYKVMDEIAARVPAGSNGVIYLPWIFGERAPVDDPTLRAALFNVSLENSREDIIRAFLEGVALNTRWVLRPAERFLGRKVTALNLVGGGAASSVWSQILADVLDVTVRQVRDPIQVNARGAAIIAAVGLGLTSFAEAGRSVEVQRVYAPTPANRAVYDRAFREFVNFYRANRGIYRRLNGDRGRQTRETTHA
jgi:xylulokinase